MSAFDPKPTWGLKIVAVQTDPFVGKSIGPNFGVGTTRPGAIVIFSEILTIDLSSERGFRFEPFLLVARLQN